ncbi:divergent polysaccharide deacetylase family protein [Paremcibacter congregatus]|uniref:Divergent polysaccharide deacetylase family protein n=1 Tax=Paremcibacter congregatus TaxID=2043170 RepID=A0A2G4YQ36_9PROT|nr:divergent polysaccharide deacetylase family protein [Paremcibacter congregatus]PHZ84390.1 hypothetical protein CRD36_11270 [Paremcibacter congregatus]QDE28608.1 divergent polysaccharide deacetylase family protein [Paremcibacter congregatus]
MQDAPELLSMTRSRTVRPLVAAWVLVFVILGAGAIWLTLAANPDATEERPAADPAVDQEYALQDRPVIIALPDDAPADHAPSAEKAPVTNPLDAPAPEIGKDSESSGRMALVPAPIDGLIMQGANGPLPVLGPDSLVAWQSYARPHDMSDTRPKVAIIVTGIGLNSKASDLAITTLPGEVDLGFSPYGRKLQDWMDKARAYGHEGFLMIPTEPLRYPENDPGPHTLLAGASSRDNLKKLDWLLSQVTGYVGVINEMGSKFTASEEDVQPVIDDLKARGLMLLDSRSTRFSVAAKLARRSTMPRAINNLYIDNQISSAEITRNLTQLENTARSMGVAVGVARALPLSIREIAAWARDLEERGIELVPITAIANRQPVR